MAEATTGPGAGPGAGTDAGAGDRTGGVGETSRRTARNAAVRAAAEVLGKVATLAWTVAAARLLSDQDFGAVSYALTMMLVLSSIAAWGFDSGLTRRGSAQPEDLARLHHAAQAWKTLLGVPLLLGGCLVLSTVAPVAGWPVLLLMLLAGFPELWSHSVRSTAAARQVSGGVSTALVAQRVVTGSGVLLALALGGGPVAVAGGFLVGSLAGWWAHRVALRRLDVARPWRDLRADDLREVASGTLLMGLSGLALILLFRIDVVLLGQISGAGEVAVYSVAYRLLETVLFVTFAVNAAVLPVLSATSSTDRRRLGLERAIAAVTAVYLPFLAVCLVDGRAVIELLFGAAYAEAAGPALAWLAPTPLFLAAATFLSSGLLAAERSRPMLVAATTALVVNTALNLALIPSLGATGAAMATLVSYVVQAAVLGVAGRSAGLRPRLARPVAPAVVATLALVLAIELLPLGLLPDLLVGGLVYAGAWLLVVRRLAPEQHQVLVGVLSRRRAR